MINSIVNQLRAFIKIIQSACGRVIAFPFSSFPFNSEYLIISHPF
nr:MAG TPA: hypothetical protein [Caudoviricetes sp.]